MNATIIDSSANTISIWFPQIVTIVAVIVGGLIGGIMPVYLEERKVKIQDYQGRQQVYSQLKGQKQLITQLYASFFMATIQLFHCSNIRRVVENRIVSGEKPAGILGDNYYRVIDEELRSAERADNLLLELGKSSQGLWEIIGKIQVLFDDTENLTNWIKKIEDSEKGFEIFETGLKNERKIRSPDVLVQISNSNFRCVTEDWPEEKEEELKKTIDNFRTKIDGLLEHLKTEIDKETKNWRIKNKI